MSKRNALNVKEDQYQQVTELARKLGTSRSGLLEMWICEELDKAESTKK